MAIVNSRKPKTLNELTFKHIEVIEKFEELLEQGIYGLTMSDIAAKLRVSLRTLYEIAPSKEHLITATMDRLFTHVGRQATAAMEEVESPMSKLRAYIKVGYEVVGPKIRKFHTDLNNVRGVVETLDYHRDYFIAQIEELLEEAVKHNEITDTDTHVVAIALGAVPLLLSDYFYHRENYQRELDVTLENSAHLIADLILEGLNQK
jgi:AcrR family transcriptional regulator|tara:strand:- start:3915 stop:4529 length:615 start_codon:yes stop_codon:yes gene_type:complete